MCTQLKLAGMQDLREFCDAVRAQHAEPNGSAAGKESSSNVSSIVQAEAQAIEDRLRNAVINQAAMKLPRQLRKAAVAACASPHPRTNLPTGSDFRAALLILLARSELTREYIGFSGLRRNPAAYLKRLYNTNDTSAAGLPGVAWARVKIESSSTQSSSPRALVRTADGSYKNWLAWQQERQKGQVRL